MPRRRLILHVCGWHGLLSGCQAEGGLSVCLCVCSCLELGSRLAASWSIEGGVPRVCRRADTRTHTHAEQLLLLLLLKTRLQHSLSILPATRHRPGHTAQPGFSDRVSVRVSARACVCVPGLPSERLGDNTFHLLDLAARPNPDSTLLFHDIRSLGRSTFSGSVLACMARCMRACARFVHA